VARRATTSTTRGPLPLLLPAGTRAAGEFYREFFDHRHEDATGLQALKNVLGTEDLLEFQRQWEKFVLELQFP